jgi:hypothetical protein
MWKEATVAEVEVYYDPTICLETLKETTTACQD